MSISPEQSPAAHWATGLRVGSLAGAVVLFAVTTFTASGLLFLVEPMFARMVLPRLGGSPSVWNTCVLFFQTALLLGYVYAHLSTKWLGIRRQSLVHGTLLLMPLALLPLNLGSSSPDAGDSPVWWLVSTMTLTVGAPFFVLSTSAPVLQRWFAALPLRSAADPYFLYAASNFGSMLALLAYPFLIEPAFGVRRQTLLWTVGYVVFIALALVCIWMVRRFADQPLPRATPAACEPLSIPVRLKWLLFAFAPSSLMLGVTMHISTDIAAVPLLWVLPLALYLVTFVLAFSSREVLPHVWSVRLAPPLVLASLVTIVLHEQQWWFLPLHVLTFFACALSCHRELAASRPHVGHLTEFYIWISVGGVLGGVFNTLISPHVFATVFEYPLVLTLTLFLIPGAASLNTGKSHLSLAAMTIGAVIVVAAVTLLIFTELPAQMGVFVLAVALGVSLTLVFAIGAAAFRGLGVGCLALLLSGAFAGGTVLFTGRSFFGVLRVVENEDHTRHILLHGSTMHGFQELATQDRCEPTSYYDRRGPVGQIFHSTKTAVAEVAVIGLGTGNLACYAEAGQRWTFYEIDPLVERIARHEPWFTFLKNSRSAPRVVIGDGRLKLRDARVGSYDLIILDAFSSDAIPIHLLTEEAMALYVSRLKPDGILAVHISNRYLRLEPVVARITERNSLFALTNIETQIPSEHAATGRIAAYWMAVARDPAVLTDFRRLPGWRVASASPAAAPWTDDYANIYSALHLR
jgi:spermidine synthase